MIYWFNVEFDRVYKRVWLYIYLPWVLLCLYQKSTVTVFLILQSINLACCFKSILTTSLLTSLILSLPAFIAFAMYCLIIYKKKETY